MVDDDGGVESSIKSSARIALTIAIQLGEKLARAYQEVLRDAQQRDAAQARELAARFEGERAAARQAVSVVNDPQWWDKATVQDVARVAETAAAWKNADPEIARADAVIASEALERYGVDLSTLRGVARDTPSGLDLAKQRAATAVPEDYQCHDDDRLTMRVRIERNPSAKRALIADYRAAIAGDVPTLELSVAKSGSAPTIRPGTRTTGSRRRSRSTRTAAQRRRIPPSPRPPAPHQSRSGGPRRPAAQTPSRQTPNGCKRAGTSPKRR